MTRSVSLLAIATLVAAVPEMRADNYVLDRVHSDATFTIRRGREIAAFTLSATLNRKDCGINWNEALDNGGVRAPGSDILQ